MPQVKLDSEATRNQILDAARQRFTHYGFGKTTMADIASDCSMSAVHVYRYFENKHDIGAAMARHELHARIRGPNRVPNPRAHGLLWYNRTLTNARQTTRRRNP